MRCPPRFFESVSLVDEALRDGSHFAHAIEELARGARRSELDVTRQALARAQGAAPAAQRFGIPPGDRSEDPGYYLISKGRPRFEKEIGYRIPLTRWLLRAYVASATPGYLGTIGLAAGFLLALPLLHAYASGMSPVALVLLGLVALFPASDLAIALVNRAVMELLGPRPLPRLELKDGST